MRRVSFFAPESRVSPHCEPIGSHSALFADLEDVGRFVITIGAGLLLLAVITVLFVASRLFRR